MRILIAAVSASSFVSGVQRHAFNVVRSLLLHPGISTVDLVLAPWQREMAARSGLPKSSRLRLHFASPERQGALARNLWYYSDLPALARHLESDIVHLAYPVPVRTGAFPCPVVVTLHDLYPHEIPMNFGLRKALFNVLILHQCMRSVDAIACVSDTTCALLDRYVPAAVRRRALRIYNCVEPELERSSGSPMADWAGEPFLLCVAQHRRNKNLLLLLKVFAQLRQKAALDPATRLVIVGITGPETNRCLSFIEQANLSAHVHLLHGLSEPELQWCFAHCAAVVAPSTVEGFGLPVVEALLAGAPVVCSDIAAFREFGGSHCRYVRLDGDACQVFADAIVETLVKPRKKPVAMPQLAAPVIAEQYVRLYRKLLSVCGPSQDAMLSASVLAAETEGVSR